MRPDLGAQQLRGFLRREAQIARPQLHELAAGAQPGQRQRWVAAAGQHHVQRGRQVVEQELHRPVHLGRLDEVVVVDHQHHVVGGRGELVHQRGDDARERRARRAGHERADPLGEARAHAIEGGDDVAPVAHRVVVAGVERQPGHGPVVGPGPGGQEARLAETGGPAHQHQLAGARLQLPDEPGPRHPTRARVRWAQLGRQQHILGGRGRR
jgi:hypothetical protein